MTKRTPISAPKNIWFDAQQVDDIALSLEQNFNDAVQSSTINNHVGTGVLPEVLVQNILFDSNLVSVIAFYSMIIIGLDADTFTQDGGTSYYEVAQEIVNVAQSAGYVGWGQGNSNQNRYFLINNLTSNTYVQFRDALYQYHFDGLDLMHKDLKSAKEKIIGAITQLSFMELNKPNSFLTRIFFDAKADEIVSIFTGGPAVDNATLLDKLFTISPINAPKWAEIKL